MATHKDDSRHGMATHRDSRHGMATHKDEGELKAAIRRLAEEKEAVVLAHYYTLPEVQEVADFVGDSLALARKAAETDAKIIVMAGVHFMAETCKLLSPEKVVLCPDPAAGCSLADSCRAEDLRRYKEEHPGTMVVSYVNTTAAVKALTDVVVTSGNALKIVNSLPQDARILFGPDYNLGSYINGVTGREMDLWPGGCHVHERFSVEAIVRLKREHPEAVVMAHLECKGPVLALADVKGSTADMLRYARESKGQEFIVATEAGILHELQRQCPGKRFWPVPPEIAGMEARPTETEAAMEARPTETGAAMESRPTETEAMEARPTETSCYCNECQYMKLNTLQKIYDCLVNEKPRVEVEPEVARMAVKPIEKMLELS